MSNVVVTRRQAIGIGTGGLAALALAACGNSADTTEDAAAASTTEATDAAQADAVVPGVTVVADEASPTGFTATFAYDASGDEKTITSVSVTGPFRFVDPELELTDEANQFTPDQYAAGMYASNYIPGAGFAEGWGYTQEMTDEDGDGVYVTSFPIASGSYAYSYVIQYEGEEEPTTIDDPANPSPAKDNPDSITATGDITHSIAYGKRDDGKQGTTPDLDFVLPAEGEAGKLEYVSYEGVDGVTQYLGVYTPAGYDASGEPYKTIYMSHGGGGNETDWFAMGHVNNIMDNALAAGEAEEAIIVTMDNAHYEWDFAKIEENVLEHIIPFVEANYNVGTDAADRAFCGLSMGGMTTMNMYFDHPTEFAYFGIWSASDMNAVKDTDGLDQPVVMTAVGTCDIASETILPNDDPENLKKYEDFVAWVEENNMSNIDCYGYVPGAHDWFTWSQLFHIFATEYLWK